MTRHLLSLDTLVKRETIAIDGIAYELRSRDELSLIDAQQFQFYGKQLDQIQRRGGKLTREQAEKGRLALDRMLSIAVIDLPDDVRSRLSDRQKAAIVEAFISLFPTEWLQAGRGKSKRGANGARRTSASRSAGSPGSTAAIPNAG